MWLLILLVSHMGTSLNNSCSTSSLICLSKQNVAPVLGRTDPCEIWMVCQARGFGWTIWGVNHSLTLPFK